MSNAAPYKPVESTQLSIWADYSVSLNIEKYLIFRSTICPYDGSYSIAE